MNENGGKYYKKIDIIALQNKKHHINKIDMQSLKPTKYFMRFLILAGFIKGSWELGKLIFEKRKNDYDKKKKMYLVNNRMEILNKIKNVKLEHVSDYLNKKDYFKIENDQGIFDLREKIIDSSSGHVLEVNCGVFINKSLYEEKLKEGKVKSISAIDSNENCLEIASANCNSDLFRFYKSPEYKIPFPDNSFDTVVDTYGLCINPHYNEQLEEIIRVCKPGGQIKLLEFGESSWTNMNYLKLCLLEKGNLKYLCYVNWLNIIEKFKQNIKEISYKRRLNGICYLIEFKKI